MRASYLYGLLGFAAFWLLTPAAAQDASVAPGINRSYENPDYQQWVGVFEQEGREVFDHREAIVAAMGLKQGMQVADIGAGTGLFTRMFADRVGAQGKVYAVDIAPSFVDNILRTSRKAGLGNVVGVVNDPVEVRLPDASIDLAFLCDTYHHFEFPRKTLESLKRALKPGGEVVVIDYQKIPGVSSSWVMGHVRAGREQVIREWQEQGFVLKEERPILQENYYLRFGLK